MNERVLKDQFLVCYLGILICILKKRESANRIKTHAYAASCSAELAVLFLQRTKIEENFSEPAKMRCCQKLTIN